MVSVLDSGSSGLGSGPGRAHWAFSIYQEIPEFRLGCKWNTCFWFVPLENFRNKRNF